MGYYVKTTASNLVILPEQKGAIYQVWCELNSPKNDHLKHGGSWVGGKKVESNFSWMDSDYDKTCSTVEEILSMMGFKFKTNSDGSLSHFHYDSKTGDEELFFKRAAPFLSPSIISWEGEEDNEFFWAFTGKSLETPFSKKAADDLLQSILEKGALEKTIALANPGTLIKL